MKNVPSKFNLGTRLILVILGIISIILLPIIYGWEESYSQYYKYLPIGFTLIFSTLSIGLYVHSNNEWKISAMALICLAIFDMYRFPLLHYSCAIFYFVFATLIRAVKKIFVVFHPTINFIFQKFSTIESHERGRYQSYEVHVSADR